jgi:hypothetical protein
MHPHHTPLEKLVLVALTWAGIILVEFFIRLREEMKEDEDDNHGDW